MNKRIMHQVYFWLKDPSSKDDLAKLLKGLRSFKAISEIKEMHIGVPASTEKRTVVDNSFSVSELLFFDNVADQKIYQDHPVHKKFVAECSGLWDKVIVYDSMEQ
jgi:hypothetical protein